jgi:hypothetical protein
MFQALYITMVIFMAKVPEDMGDTLLKLIDKLAGKGSDVKLSFQDLTLDLGMVKAKLNGSVVLDILYVSEAQQK